MSDKTIQPVNIKTSPTACDSPTSSRALALRLPEEDVERLAAAMKAVAHPVRIKILDLIAQGDGEVCSCEIERFFDLSQPTISHHIKQLHDAGLITSEPRGVWVYHKVQPEVIALLRDYLGKYSC